MCWFWATTFSCFDVLILLDKTKHPLVILSVVPGIVLSIDKYTNTRVTELLPMF